MPMSTNRQGIDESIQHHVPPTSTISEQLQVEQYMKTLKKNPFHSLCYDNAPTLHKLILPDGSIAFSIHPNTTALLKSLTDQKSNEPHENRAIYLHKQHHFNTNQHTSFSENKNKSTSCRHISSKSTSNKQK